MTLTIRRYRAEDAEATLTVFQRAIRITAAADYCPDQIDAWIGNVDQAAWAHRRGDADTWIAGDNDAVMGFADIDAAGYIDMMFVDPAVGRAGVATALLEHLRTVASVHRVIQLSVNASATARPFFERHGFIVRSAQQVERGGVLLRNYRMTAPVTEFDGR